jgi:hypothetical protein
VTTFLHGLAQQLIFPLFIVLCFYFTLTYFHHLKMGDDRGIKKTKWAAVVCLALALVAPALYNVIMFMIIMR